MGGSSSKHNAAAEKTPSPSPEPADSSVVGRSRSYRSRVFQSSCLGSHSDDKQVGDHRRKGNGGNGMCLKKTKIKSGEAESRCSRKGNVERRGIGLDEWGQSSLPDSMPTGGGTPSRVLSSRSIDSASNFPSRCSCLPGTVSFRLQRANSLSSSGAFCTSSTRFVVSNDANDVHGRSSTSDVSVSGDERPQICDFFPACFPNRSPRVRHRSFSSNNMNCGSPSPSFSNSWQPHEQITSRRHHGVRGSSTDGCGSSPRNHIYQEHFDTGVHNRRIGAREPIDRNVRFSRTLSVGRLRERSSFLDLAFSPFQQDRELGHRSQTCRTPASGASSEPKENVRVSPASPGHPRFFVSGSPFRSQECETGISRTRRARYLDPLEHQSNFIERGRRIRSQARALQRLGSRFQHLSAHERSCTLSGQHRTGHCTCRPGRRGNNSNNEPTARASISRIVMLAEALFEVLDEIHQQSVVLSSQTSVSPVGSVPAPNDIVESFPVKLYSRVQKHWDEENAQCYICLVEYEEGDTVRVLPCHHEFHSLCIDKWLKEIHRVCPLCRGDVCRLPWLDSQH